MQKSITFIMWQLLHRVEKSKIKIQFAFLHLLSLLMVSVTGLLFCSTQQVSTTVKKHLFVIICLHLPEKQKIILFYVTSG